MRPRFSLVIRSLCSLQRQRLDSRSKGPTWSHQSLLVLRGSAFRVQACTNFWRVRYSSTVLGRRVWLSAITGQWDTSIDQHTLQGSERQCLHCTLNVLVLWIPGTVTFWNVRKRALFEMSEIQQVILFRTSYSGRSLLVSKFIDECRVSCTFQTVPEQIEPNFA